mgnify:CR=1 FL=1
MILDLVGNFMTEATKSHVKVSSTVDTWSWTLKGPHGGKLTLYCKEILHTMTAAATNSITAAVPNGVCVLAFTGIVTEASTAHNTRTGMKYSLDLATDVLLATHTLTSYKMVAGTRFLATTTTATMPTQVVADTDILIEATGGSGNFVASGQVRLQIWYFFISAPTH